MSIRSQAERACQLDMKREVGRAMVVRVQPSTSPTSDVSRVWLRFVYLPCSQACLPERVVVRRQPDCTRRVVLGRIGDVGKVVTTGAI